MTQNDYGRAEWHASPATGLTAMGDQPCGRKSSAGCGVGAVGADNPASRARRPIAQDRHASGNERDPMGATHRLPLALLAARRVFRRARRRTPFSADFEREGVWETISPELPCASGWGGRLARPRQCSTASRQITRRRTGRDGQCYDAGKHVGGRRVSGVLLAYRGLLSWWFHPPRASGCFRFGQATFAGPRGNGQDAPKASVGRVP